MIARTSRLLAATLGLVLLTTASSRAQGVTPGEAYLNALTQIARLELSALPLEVRAAMHQDPRWRQAYGRDGVVSAFAGMGEPDFAARVNHVFAVSRERATTHGGLLPAAGCRARPRRRRTPAPGPAPGPCAARSAPA